MSNGQFNVGKEISLKQLKTVKSAKHILAGDGDKTVGKIAVDSLVKKDSKNLITSGAVYELLYGKSKSLSNIIATGNVIVPETQVSHATLLGLDADDHPQYLTEARANALYSLGAHDHVLDDLTDVDTAGVATGSLLYKSAGDWVDTGSGLTWNGSTLGVTGYNAAILKLTATDPSLAANQAVGVIQFDSSDASYVGTVGQIDTQTIAGNYGSRFQMSFQVYDVSGGGFAERLRLHGSGAAVSGSLSVSGNVSAASLIKSGGTSSQFLKADGSVDSSTYLTSYTETDPIFSAHDASAVTAALIANWNAAHGWGDHSGLYDTTGTATAAVASHESTYNHANYNTAYGWGDHSGLYSPSGHDHSGVYEPAFSKNTGFNLTLGTGSGQVAEGDHTHAGGSSNLDDLSDVDTTGVSTGSMLYKSAGDWLDTGGAVGFNGTDLTVANSIRMSNINPYIYGYLNGTYIDMYNAGAGIDFMTGGGGTKSGTYYGNLTVSGTFSFGGHLGINTASHIWTNNNGGLGKIKLYNGGAGAYMEFSSLLTNAGWGGFRYITSAGTIMEVNKEGDIDANSFIKAGGLSTEFLKADGSVDSNTYATGDLGDYLPLAGGTLTGALLGTSIELSGVITAAPNTDTTHTFGRLTLWNTSVRTYIAHNDNANADNYAFYQNSAGDTHLNAKSGRSVSYSIDDTVVGSFTASSQTMQNGIHLRMGSSAGNAGQIRFGDVDTYIYESSDDVLSFVTNSVEALSLDATQNAFFSADLTAASLIKTGGLSSQFLKADGSVDSTVYGTGNGDVTKVGTPVNDQVAIWTGDGTAYGEANLTFNANVLQIGSGTGTFKARAFTENNANHTILLNQTGLRSQSNLHKARTSHEFYTDQAADPTLTVAILKNRTDFAGVINATGAIEGSSFNKIGGLSTEFLMADGSVNSSSFGDYLPLAGGTMTGGILLPDGSTTVPALTQASNTDSGIYFGSNTIGFTVNSVARIVINGSGFIAPAANAAAILNEAATATNPTLIPHRSDFTTGVGAAASGQLSLITGGVEALNIDASQNALFSANLTAASLVKTGGLSTEYLMADGSVTTGGGASSAGGNNELQASDGSGGFQGTNVSVSSINANMQMGSSSLAGHRNIAVESSYTDAYLLLTSKGDGGQIWLNSPEAVIGDASKAFTPRLTVTSSNTNDDLWIVPKGTGTVIVRADYEDDVADGSLVNKKWVDDQGFGVGSGIGGSIADNQVAYGNGTNIAGEAVFTYNDSTDFLSVPNITTAYILADSVVIDNIGAGGDPTFAASSAGQVLSLTGALQGSSYISSTSYLEAGSYIQAATYIMTSIATETNFDAARILTRDASGNVHAVVAAGTPTGKFLKDDGTWDTAGGAGDVTKVGTPADNRLGVWTGNGTIEGSPNFYQLDDSYLTVIYGDGGAGTGLHLDGSTGDKVLTYYTDISGEQAIVRAANGFNGAGNNAILQAEVHNTGGDAFSKYEGSTWSWATGVDNSDSNDFKINYTASSTATPSSGTNIFIAKTDGQIQLSQYGGGSITGTASKWLAVDSNGNIIEENAPSGGSGTILGSVAATAGLIAYANGTLDTITTDSDLIYTGGSLKVSGTNPQFIAKGTGGTGSSAVTYLSYQDSAGSQVGQIGFTSSGNSTLRIANYLTTSNVTLNADSTDLLVAHSNGIVQLPEYGGGSIQGTATKWLAVDTDGNIIEEDAPSGSSGTVTAVNNGNGMNFTNITGSGTVTLGTPTTCHASTSNAVQVSSHTHAITGFSATGHAHTDEAAISNSAVNTSYFSYWGNSASYKMQMAQDTYMTEVSELDTGADYNIYHKISGGTSRGFVWYNTTYSSGAMMQLINGSLRVKVNLYAVDAQFSSDRRLKENIKPLTSQRDKIRELASLSSSYRWKDSKKRDMGWIAQDIKHIYPDHVEHNVGNDSWSVNYPKLLVPVAQVVGEHEKEIRELKAQLASVTAKLEKLT